LVDDVDQSRNRSVLLDLLCCLALELESSFVGTDVDIEECYCLASFQVLADIQDLLILSLGSKCFFENIQVVVDSNWERAQENSS